MSFSKYPEYKGSGVEWLGEVPAHWYSKRLKFLFELVKREVRDEDRIVTCFRDGEVTLRANRRTDGFTNALKEIGYQGIRVGDLVIHAMDAFAGAIGVSDSNGKSSPVYSVCIPTFPYVSARYYGDLLRNMAVSGFVASLAKGIRERSTDFRWTDARDIYLPVPSVEEQTQIARFLNHETARIDALIEEQQRLIELLKEKRQAVISHAVTKGLDPDVPMKDSGVEWLGEVPAHWEVTKLSYITNRIGSGKTPSGGATAYVSSGVPFIRSQNVHDQGLRLDDIVYIDEATDRGMAWSRVRPLDILINITGASIGRSCQVPAGFGRANVNQHVCVIRLDNSEETSDWVAWAMKAPSTNEQVKVSQTGAAREGLNFEQLAGFYVSMPPLQERRTISTFLDQETARIDALIKEAESAIELLQERRSALISAAVTGKIDVRGWSAETADSDADLPVAAEQRGEYSASGQRS